MLWPASKSEINVRFCISGIKSMNRFFEYKEVLKRPREVIDMKERGRPFPANGAL